jgi:DNA mismatch endonuclease, patch repair protein
MGDNLTQEQRSYCMSRVKGKDTGLERLVRSGLQKRGLRFRKHVKNLPGRPDVVFHGARVAVFVDGDFWHGYRFALWAHQVSEFWQRKIQGNRERDRRNFARLRRQGWKVIRIWQHELEKDVAEQLDRIVESVIR